VKEVSGSNALQRQIEEHALLKCSKPQEFHIFPIYQQTNCSAFHVLIQQQCTFRAGLGLLLSNCSNKTTVPALYWFNIKDKKGLNFEGSPCLQRAQLQTQECNY